MTTAKWKRTGDLTDSEYIELLKSRTVYDDNDCWLYQGYQNGKGYCPVHYHGKRFLLTRLVFQMFKGPLHPERIVCHHCDVRNCWNPAHIYDGTPLSNMRDTVSRFRHYNLLKTSCKRGHPFVEGSYRLSGPSKNIRACIVCENYRRRLKRSLNKARYETGEHSKL